jgi:protein-L-isoaspartate O-methyltransferase
MRSRSGSGTVRAAGPNAPFDRILVTAAAPAPPPALTDSWLPAERMLRVYACIAEEHDLRLVLVAG